jgi:hypothetical protein
MARAWQHSWLQEREASERLLKLLREVAVLYPHNGACGKDGYNPPFDGADCLRCRLDATLAETDSTAPTMPKVVWKYQAARLGRYSLHTFSHGWPTPTEWSCEVHLADPTVYRHGFKTEKEAQDAAVALVLNWSEE